MSGKSGKNWLLKMGDGAGSESFAVIGGTREVQFTMDGTAIDTTSQDSNDWKEILGGSGLKSAKVSGSGVAILSDAQYKAVRTVFLNGTIRHWQIVDVDESETATGSFKITAFEKAGEYKGEQTWSLTLESSGAITFS